MNTPYNDLSGAVYYMNDFMSKKVSDKNKRDCITFLLSISGLKVNFGYSSYGDYVEDGIVSTLDYIRENYARILVDTMYVYARDKLIPFYTVGFGLEDGLDKKEFKDKNETVQSHINNIYGMIMDYPPEIIGDFAKFSKEITDAMDLNIYPDEEYYPENLDDYLRMHAKEDVNGNYIVDKNTLDLIALHYGNKRRGWKYSMIN